MGLDLLVGWKAIAGFFEVTVHTVKKYHKDYGMPVYRLPSGKPVSIPAELISWITEYDKISDGTSQRKYNFPLK